MKGSTVRLPDAAGLIAARALDRAIDAFDPRTDDSIWITQVQRVA
jgi:hypothetical protein